MATAIVALLLKYYGGEAFIKSPDFLEIFMGSGSGIGCNANMLGNSSQPGQIQILDESYNIVCSGNQAAYRICAGASFFFLSMIIVAPLCKIYHTGMWILKIFLLLGLMVACFFIPMPFYDGYKYVAMGASIIFLVMQILALMDFSYKIHGWMLNKSDEEDEKNDNGQNTDSSCTGCKIFYVILSFLLIGAFITGIVMMYVTFSKHSDTDKVCSIGVGMTTLTLILGIIVIILSLVGKLNVGLLPGSIVICYLCWLCFSALSTNPDGTCNKFNVDPTTARTTDTTLSFVFIVLSLGWTAFSTSKTAPGLSAVANKNDDSEDEDEEKELEMQARDDLNDVLAGKKKADDKYHVPEKDDEKPSEKQSSGNKQTYSSGKERGKIALFHVMMFFSTFYAAMMVTNWEVLEQTSNGGKPTTGSAIAMWLQLGAQWLCFLIFVWTLIAPLACPNRQFE